MPTGMTGTGGTFKFAIGTRFSDPLGPTTYITTAPGSFVLDPTYRWALAVAPGSNFAQLLPAGAPLNVPTPATTDEVIACEDVTAPGVPVLVPKGTAVTLASAGLAVYPDTRARESF